MAGILSRPINRGLICNREGCGGPRQVALFIEFESMKAGENPMRVFTGLEVCRPCAWKIRKPTEVFKREYVERLRQAIADSGAGQPKAEASVKYCSLTHPDYVRFAKMRGLY